MPAVVEAAVARAVAVPSSAVHAHVASVRRRHPDATPAEVIAYLEREYLVVVASTGGAVGAVAAAPAVGTGVALVLTASDVATFFAGSAAFVLAVASVHGIDVEDVDRRTAVLLTTLLGESGARAVGDVTELGAFGVGRLLLTRMPIATVRKVNLTLTRRMVRKQLARQGGLFFGRLLPFGIGIVIGAAGGRALGREVVKGARAAFGAAPSTFCDVIEVTGPHTGAELPDDRSLTQH
ncbi:hypothetical protein [Cellulomonas composti]|uniref:Uncharacterized protein n=1 Tax=Cellulomonas composti TaxID=266130 RepID=A0A511JAQ3_9CELL|nr:hypothetical protein [Cellulomonas composti]GEL95066.1 hypothetical protein CCO02nite_17240 [Cellulomonas composti]